MKKTAFTTFLLCCAFVCFSQNSFSLPELLKLNRLSAEQLTQELKGRIPVIENSQDAFIKGWRFTNPQKHSIAKAILPNNDRSLTLQGPAPFSAASFRKQLALDGFTFLHQTS